jgi:hypothetical protein
MCVSENACKFSQCMSVRLGVPATKLWDRFGWNLVLKTYIKFCKVTVIFVWGSIYASPNFANFVGTSLGILCFEWYTEERGWTLPALYLSSSLYLVLSGFLLTVLKELKNGSRTVDFGKTCHSSFGIPRRTNVLRSSSWRSRQTKLKECWPLDYSRPFMSFSISSTSAFLANRNLRGRWLFERASPVSVRRWILFNRPSRSKAVLMYCII